MKAAGELRRGAAKGLEADRRSKSRHKVAGLSCIMKVNGTEYPVEVGDISEAGLQGEVDVSVHAGQVVEVHFDPERSVRATVRWGVGPYVGLEFEHPMPIGDLVGED